jgi:hypothetical protein
MPLKLIRMKKPKAAAAKTQKKSEIDKFIDAIDVQLRIASGEKVKKGKGLAKSWMEDGAAFGTDKVLRPKVGNAYLWSKSALAVDTKKKDAPTTELKAIKKEAEDGKLSNRIYAALRSKKKDAAKK